MFTIERIKIRNCPILKTIRSIGAGEKLSM